MREIRQLIKIIRKKGQRSIQLVNQNFRKNETSKDNLLYEGITNNQFHTDESAAREIFGTDPGNRNYRNAKGKLKSKLFNHLYFLDYEKEAYTNYEKSRYDALHTLHQSQILITEKSPDIAIRLLNQLVKICKDYEFTTIGLQALTILRDEYAKKGKLTPYKEVTEDIKRLRKLHETYEKCEATYYQYLVQINKSVSAQNRILPRIPKAINEIKAAAKKLKSDSLYILAAELEIRYNEIRQQFGDNIKICTDLEKKYLNRPNNEVKVNLQQHDISFVKLQSYLFLGDLKAGKPYATRKIDALKAGSKTWFKFSEYYFLLLMKGENYKEASSLFRKVRTNKNFNLLADHLKSRWHIYRAFLIFFNESKILRWGFNMEEFLEERPCYERDYNGYNISTLVIQFMFLLRDGNVALIKECVEEILKYKSAHLDKRHNYRSSIFIRMLEIILDKEFDYEQIYEKGQTYYNKLVNTPIPSDLKQDSEVIPYQILWGHILDILKTNKAYIHFRFYNLKAM